MSNFKDYSGRTVEIGDIILISEKGKFIKGTVTKLFENHYTVKCEDGFYRDSSCFRDCFILRKSVSYEVDTEEVVNEFTTIEQSKKLLELGLPADSADCYYLYGYGEEGYSYSEEPYVGFPDTKDDIPCWSVGRLQRIYQTCTNDSSMENVLFGLFKSFGACQVMIDTITAAIGIDFDISKFKINESIN